MERLAGELLRAMIEREPAYVLQAADACLAWKSEDEDRYEALAAVATSAHGRYTRGGSGVLPAELTLLTHFLA
jgi:hypothetical protein